jgi:proteasome lid subunit RPN8/RPN11
VNVLATGPELWASTEARLAAAPHSLAPGLWVGLRTPQQVRDTSYREREHCGLLIGDPDSGCVLLELPNAAKRNASRFEINAASLAALMELGIEWSGVWHTHPPIPTRSRLADQLAEEDKSAGPRPSLVDLDYHPLAYRMFIWHLGEMREFNVEGEELGAWSVAD